MADRYHYRDTVNTGGDDAMYENAQYYMDEYLNQQTKKIETDAGNLNVSEGVFVGDTDADGHLEYAVDSNHDGTFDTIVEALGAFFNHGL